jgi:hypothetical protein
MLGSSRLTLAMYCMLSGIQHHLALEIGCLSLSLGSRPKLGYDSLQQEELLPGSRASDP